jgi:hypothetical protein
MWFRGRYEKYLSKARVPYVLMKEDGFDTISYNGIDDRVLAIDLVSCILAPGIQKW